SGAAPISAGGPGQAPAPITPETHAKNEIQIRIKEYCAALETLDPAKIQQVYPTVNVPALRDQFRQYKSNKCTLAGAPKLLLLDAIGGTAKLEVGVKQIIEMQSGGAPKTLETIAMMTLSRPEVRSTWRIGSVAYKPKPKE